MREWRHTPQPQCVCEESRCAQSARHRLRKRGRQATLCRQHTADTSTSHKQMQLARGTEGGGMKRAPPCSVYADGVSIKVVRMRSHSLWCLLEGEHRHLLRGRTIRAFHHGEVDSPHTSTPLKTRRASPSTGQENTRRWSSCRTHVVDLTEEDVQHMTGTNMPMWIAHVDTSFHFVSHDVICVCECS